MSVARLEEEVSIDEFARWAAYYKWQGEERKRALDKVKAEAKVKKKSRKG